MLQEQTLFELEESKSLMNHMISLLQNQEDIVLYVFYINFFNDKLKEDIQSSIPSSSSVSDQKAIKLYIENIFNHSVYKYISINNNHVMSLNLDS